MTRRPDSPLAARGSRLHKSMTTSPIGCEQQTRRLPLAGLSRGSGPYTTAPETKPLSQLWHTPVRHDQRTGTSHASASSNMLWYADPFQCAAMPLRAKDTRGPVLASSLGRCGARFDAATTPGVIDSLPLKSST